MRFILSLTFLLAFSLASLSQKINEPNYGLKSPSSAEIVYVEYQTDFTEVDIVISNEIENGFFCLDRNTKLIKPDSTFVTLIGVKGLPFCPDIFRFKKIGETVTVKLFFPPTGKLDWFSLVEECGGGCLKFLGVITDTNLNAKLNDAFDFEANGDFDLAFASYRKIIEEYEPLDTGIEGAVYAVLIKLLSDKGETDLAKEWYVKMLLSKAPDLSLYIYNLGQQGVRF